VLMDQRFVGQAGVHRVMSELALRNVSGYLPSIDVGVDILTNEGVRIQVKAAHLRARKISKGQPSYQFGIGWCQVGNAHKPQRRLRAYSTECDFFVLWGIDEDRFWIVPSKVFDNRQILLLYPGRTKSLIRRLDGFVDQVYQGEDRWDLLMPKQADNESTPLVAFPVPVAN
jgi:hypothetical protein